MTCRVERAPYCAKVGCAWAAARYLLNGDSVADSSDDRYELEADPNSDQQKQGSSGT